MVRPSPKLSVVRLSILKIGQSTWQPPVQLSCPLGSFEKKYRAWFCLSTRYLPKVAFVCKLTSFSAGGLGGIALLSFFLQLTAAITKPLISAIVTEIFIVFIFKNFDLMWSKATFNLTSARKAVPLFYRELRLIFKSLRFRPGTGHTSNALLRTCD